MEALEHLDAELRHPLTQSIAAGQLEGWRPTGEHVAALVGLARDEVSFGTYLANRRARYPPAAPPVRNPRRLFRRHKPYLLPGTALLRNNFGVESATALADLEFVATAGRLLQWHRRLVDGQVGIDDLDVRMLHRHVFADVYSWAGDYRVTELRRGETVFARQSSVAAVSADVENDARRVATPGKPLDLAELAYWLSRLYADYNQVHPFREGNGRTGSLLLHTVAALRGARLDLSRLRREDWYEASRDSMPFRRDGRASPRPFIPLFVHALG